MQNKTLYFRPTDFNSNFVAYLAIFGLYKKNMQMHKNPGSIIILYYIVVSYNRHNMS